MGLATVQALNDSVALISGQMRKTPFLAVLRSAVCETADRALARAGRDTRGCPYIEKWLGEYSVARRYKQCRRACARRAGQTRAGQAGQQATASAATMATRDPTGMFSLRVQRFVDLVNKNGIRPITQYARDNWPAKPEEFFSEAFALWHSDPQFPGRAAPSLKAWFDAGEHLK